MTNAYEQTHLGGEGAAIGAMIDFYGGFGSWAAMPAPVRAYAEATTAVNLLDWRGAYGFILDENRLASLNGLPVRVVAGELSHPAVVRANALIADRITGASFTLLAGAAHFMIATHPAEVAALIMQAVLAISAKE